jgi:hypothetical protein
MVANLERACRNRDAFERRLGWFMCLLAAPACECERETHAAPQLIHALLDTERLC